MDERTRKAFARDAKAWRDERDKADPLGAKPPPSPPPASCETCHPGPCWFPTFCAVALNPRHGGGNG